MKVEGGRAGKDNSESFFFFIQLICCCCFLQNLSGIFFSVYCVSQHFTESDLKDALKHLSWCSLNYSNIFRMQMRCVVKVTLKQPVTFFFYYSYQLCQNGCKTLLPDGPAVLQEVNCGNPAITTLDSRCFKGTGL